MTDKTSAAPKRSFKEVLKIFFQRRTLVMIGLGFASGLPLSLIFDTLSIWLRSVDLSLTAISYFSLVTFVYSLKFVWAPVLDRISIPGLTYLMGHRRGWILLSQVVIMFGLWAISTLNPQTQLPLMALVAILIGFAGATQDVVIDAWRIETAGDSTDNQAVLATATAWGARIAPFVSGIVPLLLADTLGWGFAYALMAALMGIGVLAVLFAPKEAEHKVRSIDYGDAEARPGLEALEWGGRLLVMLIAICLLGAGLTANVDLFKGLFPSESAFEAVKTVWTARETGIFLQLPAVLLGLTLLVMACLPLPGTPTRPGAYLRQTFVVPIVAFFERYENIAWLILAMICIYRVSDFVLNVNGAFYVDLGFDLPVIAEVRKIFGVIMTMAGVALGGIVMTRFGIKFSLIFGAIVGSLSNLAYAWLATKGNDVMAFSIALGIDNASGGVAGTVLIAYMSSLISKGYAAQQYALFTSLYALPGKLLASQSGKIVEESAKASDGQSWVSGFFANTPAIAYAKPAETLGVSPHALGAGYMLFFTYTALIGVVAIILAVWVIRAYDPDMKKPAEKPQPV
ncbi:AmpG family muropeptide MFS transporter [Asticcacaulis machinosus]|uniref:MFS transporter n=1 Tax=Asticcacaulis machinosus TaxID=2984211 RepID=A0ABT5HKK4_9CAUL|nr:MFS transporter [Asticcacaulis machinosus]MDC7676753.1 MFS transporter [Asticcacaulis machinosus]